jgi:general L-amino acid transport system substrate-binding protein
MLRKLSVVGATMFALLCGASQAQTIKTYATPTLDAVKARGKVACGVNQNLLGFSAQDASGEWRGFDAEFCRAVAAAALGKPEAVDFIHVDGTERFPALQNKTIDLLVRNTTWTMQRQVEYGFDFVGVNYYDGQGFMAHADEGLVTAQQLTGRPVCVLAGTTTEANMAFYFKSVGVTATVKTYDSRRKMLDDYKKGDCGAYSADRSALAADRASFDNPTEHTILPEVISKEPLGPAVRSDDRAWSEVVRLTLIGLINAEEIGLNREAATSGKPLAADLQRVVDGADLAGTPVGLPKGWLLKVVGAVGNYGELFERNLGESGPVGIRRGLNALWKQGGILYAPPLQ